MPAVLASVTLTTGNPGDQITLTGTGFLAGAVVTFVGGGQTLTDPLAVVVSGTSITATVPDFGGDATALSITVTNSGEDATAGVAYALQQYPPVDSIYPLCGLNAVRRALNLDDVERDLDDTLRRLILMASGAMAGLITMDIKPVTVTNELRDGDGTSSLELLHSPVVSVSAVTIWGQAVDPSELKVYNEYIAFDEECGIWNPRIQSMTRIFPRGRQNIAVSYVAGFTNVPSDLSDACIEQVMFLRNTLSKEGMLSEQNSQTSATTQYSQLPVAPHVQQVCNRYRRTAVKAV